MIMIKKKCWTKNYFWSYFFLIVIKNIFYFEQKKIWSKKYIFDHDQKIFVIKKLLIMIKNVKTFFDNDQKYFLIMIKNEINQTCFLTWVGLVNVNQNQFSKDLKWYFLLVFLLSSSKMFLFNIIVLITNIYDHNKKKIPNNKLFLIKRFFNRDQKYFWSWTNKYLWSKNFW